MTKKVNSKTLNSIEKIRSVLNDVVLTEDCFEDIVGKSCLHCTALEALDHLKELQDVLMKGKYEESS